MCMDTDYRKMEVQVDVLVKFKWINNCDLVIILNQQQAHNKKDRLVKREMHESFIF